jgi:zinc protease
MGERRVQVERPGHTAFLETAYRAPAAHDDDWFKLAILDSVLSGPSGVGSGQIDNKTSRLYKALVNTELAAGVYGYLQASIDPYLYSFTVTVRDGRTLGEVEAGLDEQLDRMCSENIRVAELEKAKKQARALFAYSTEGVTGQARWLAVSENFGGHDWFEDYITRVEAVTVEDVREVAQRYLRPQNRTVGWLIPTGLNGKGDHGS